MVIKVKNSFTTLINHICHILCRNLLFHYYLDSVVSYKGTGFSKCLFVVDTQAMVPIVVDPLIVLRA